MTETLSFYGRGKLLLTSEYFVMDGAKALALPTKIGQKMNVEIKDSQNSTIHWIAKTHDNKEWINTSFNFDDLDSEDDLQNIIDQARELNPNFLNNDNDICITTTLEFNKDWGLGSSSTLLYMISQWANVNPYELLKNTFGGSGYDIACAAADTPILYCLENNNPTIEQSDFNPTFKDNLYFVYLNKKQNSRDGINHYKKQDFDKLEIIQKLDKITNNICHAETLSDFENLIKNHENIISNALNLPTVQSQYFNDYWGQTKSLGAWGGDFILVTSNKSNEETFAYFRERGYKTVLRYKDLIK